MEFCMKKLLLVLTAICALASPALAWEHKILTIQNLDNGWTQGNPNGGIWEFYPAITHIRYTVGAHHWDSSVLDITHGTIGNFGPINEALGCTPGEIDVTITVPGGTFTVRDPTLFPACTAKGIIMSGPIIGGTTFSFKHI